MKTRRTRLALHFILLITLPGACGVAQALCDARLEPIPDKTSLAGNGDANIGFGIRGTMWMASKFGVLKCIVHWQYEVTWVDGQDHEQTRLFQGVKEFDGRGTAVGERQSEPFSGEASEQIQLASAGGPPKQIVRVVVKHATARPPPRK